MNLIESFDSYKDFNVYAFFTVCFNVLPSGLKADLPIKKSKKNFEKLIKSIDFEKYTFKPVYKNWVTEDTSDADGSNDYPHFYLMKSEDKNIIFYLSFDEETVELEFLYDLNDSEAEKWVQSTNEKLRVEFGERKTPKFKVLSRSRNSFSTEDVKTVDFKSIEIKELYNDDFLEINGIINESLHLKKSGLILLHGEPGNGKTTYIKHLISVFNEINFIFIQNEFINDLLTPSFISFLLNNKNSVLIIEDAEKVINTREETNASSVVSTILQLTDGLFSDYLNIKIICTFNTDIKKVDKALLRKGRMVAKYKFEKLSAEKVSKLLKKQNKKPISKELSLAEIFNVDAKEFNNIEEKEIGFKAQR